MKKHIFWFVLAVGLTQHTMAIAAPDLTGKKFVMKGAFDGSASAVCNPVQFSESILSRQLQINPAKNLPASITFNQGNSFLWSEKKFTGPLVNEPGTWVPHSDKAALLFDDESVSSIESLPQLILSQLSNNGLDGTLTKNRYRFFAKPNSKGNKLTVTETGRYRFKAKGFSNGFKVTCDIRINVKRVYKGRAVF